MAFSLYVWFLINTCLCRIDDRRCTLITVRVLLIWHPFRQHFSAKLNAYLILVANTPWWVEVQCVSVQKWTQMKICVTLLQKLRIALVCFTFLHCLHGLMLEVQSCNTNIPQMSYGAWKKRHQKVKAKTRACMNGSPPRLLKSAHCPWECHTVSVFKWRFSFFALPPFWQIPWFSCIHQVDASLVACSWQFVICLFHCLSFRETLSEASL